MGAEVSAASTPAHSYGDNAAPGAWDALGDLARRCDATRPPEHPRPRICATRLLNLDRAAPASLGAGGSVRNLLESRAAGLALAKNCFALDKPRL